MCNCISYNLPEGYQTEEEVVLKNRAMTGKDSVCIDACIVDDIKLLWENNICTLSSCCGHNTQNKSVVINKPDAKRAKELLPDFDILYWDLCSYKEKKEEIKCGGIVFVWDEQGNNVDEIILVDFPKTTMIDFDIEYDVKLILTPKKG